MAITQHYKLQIAKTSPLGSQSIHKRGEISMRRISGFMITAFILFILACRISPSTSDGPQVQSSEDKAITVEKNEIESSGGDSSVIQLEIIGSNLYEYDSQYFLDVVAKNPTGDYIYGPNFHFILPDLDYAATHGSLAVIVPPNAYVSNHITLSNLTEIPNQWTGNYVVDDVEGFNMLDPFIRDNWENRFYPYLEITNVRLSDENPEKYICMEIQNIGSDTYKPVGDFGLNIAYMFFDSNNAVLSVGTLIPDNSTEEIAPHETVSRCGFYDRLPFHDRIDNIEAIAIGHLAW